MPLLTEEALFCSDFFEEYSSCWLAASMEGHCNHVWFSIYVIAYFYLIDKPTSLSLLVRPEHFRCYLTLASWLFSACNHLMVERGKY